MDAEYFWRITLREFLLIVEATQRRQIDQHNQFLMLAWHVATLQREPKLTRAQFTRRFAPYERKAQTREQMLAALKMIGNTVRTMARNG